MSLYFFTSRLLQVWLLLFVVFLKLQKYDKIKSISKAGAALVNTISSILVVILIDFHPQNG